VLGYGLDDRGVPVPEGTGIFFSSPPYEGLFPWPRHEAGHSLPPSAEVKECMELYLHSALGIHGVVLTEKKARVNFTFYLYHRVQTGSGAHPASYPMDIRGFFPWE
jgi:hypothetical protein